MGPTLITVRLDRPDGTLFIRSPRRRRTTRKGDEGAGPGVRGRGASELAKHRLEFHYGPFFKPGRLINGAGHAANGLDKWADLSLVACVVRRRTHPTHQKTNATSLAHGGTPRPVFRE